MGITKILLFALVALPIWSAEQVLLRTGFAIRCESHTSDGETVFLQTGSGVVSIKASEIAGFELEEVFAQPILALTISTAEIPKSQPVLTTKELIDNAARTYGIPASFIHSVVQAESGYNVNALSPKGAIGLMQLMPATAKSLGADPNDPKQNVEAGVRHLTDLLFRFKDDPEQLRKTLAAYNAGLGAVEKYNGVPPYQETQLYVEKILNRYNYLRK